ncbi:MAG: SOS response-associated peptidase [Alphaproteobacteria bacterium]|nr:MAG: SOS response-associated peptidase [Alphaproteobacteria bacterium]
MCGRYSLTSPVEALRALFQFDGPLPNLAPNYNVAPTQAVPIVRLEQGVRHLAFARWGLIPSWAKEVSAKPLINARAETVAEKPSFRAAFRRRRCLVPADGYFEWQKTRQGTKQPYNIVLSDTGPFGMAGIWQTWSAADGSEIDSVAIITIDANSKLAPIHDRMPVILKPADYDRWLDSDRFDRQQAKALLRPAQQDFLRAYPISRRVNAVSNNDAAIVAPVGDGLQG